MYVTKNLSKNKKFHFQKKFKKRREKLILKSNGSKKEPFNGICKPAISLFQKLKL